MPTTIRVLNDNSINKIAAGEVIENPASVVKELLENALDSGATEVSVEIKAGGRQLIRILDNGCGMSTDDALLSLERHATSKISGVDDLEEISTMGFRGEAIPSIASISKFVMLTCPHGDAEATMVTVDGGKIMSCRPAARSPGTTIEISSLFFNVPVRKKFQKNISQDTGQIHKVVGALALANPGVSFDFIVNEKKQLSLKAWDDVSFTDSLKTRIADVLGKEFLESSRHVYHREGDIIVEGVVGIPSYTRPNRSGQHIFINKRPLSSPTVSYAVADGYSTRLTERRFPAFLLHITLPGSLIDVNVHPQKREVRFHNEKAIRKTVSTGVDKALMKALHPKHDGIDSSAPTVSPTFSPSDSALPKNMASFSVPTFRNIIPEPAFSTEDVLDVITLPQVLGVLGEYLLLDASSLDATKKGLAIVDRRRAQFRIFFEELIDGSSQRGISSLGIQNLLIPITLEFSAAEAVLLKEHLDILNGFGVGIRDFGGNDFVVDAIPQSLDSGDVASFVDAIIENLGAPGKLKKERREKLAVAVAKAAIPKKNTLTANDSQSIVNTLMKCSDPYQTPQGEAIVATITEEELQKKFY
ncbi:MAG: DNA mismatch repair endonuclease MutL [Waddliaceae bacterium]|jgi:DNA mismatch repair protein MutL|nr:DNA mismatch repair endonuclease MutL [Waddliaceae bacterium]MBT3579341.1 DNA mismatch repair endonuclease MutL [Waddliaceae bacterium]MBT4444831.1 DNA mismatch repair endonuclease MutL [Waddliaceae bacterium]MBT6928033.1 DNA mismatch repair endonuclease MutL [Waddliaceae bacterium]MBT7264291.1 DNA mismatch repair endonuclease MutL [Waddliaceae bacterium]